MLTPLETFATRSDENSRLVCVIRAALQAAFGDKEGGCTLLDCGAQDGRFMSAIVQSSGLRCHVIGTDNDATGLAKAQQNYRNAGAESAHVTHMDITLQDIHSIRFALGWSNEANSIDTIPKADMLLASHIGYYLPLSLQYLSLRKMTQLIAPEGMMVLVHSDGNSQFDTLRADMGKAINQGDNAQQLTHTRLQKHVDNFRLSHFEVRLPCRLHLPNDEAALRAAWFGNGREALSEEGQRNLNVFENIISFTGGENEMAVTRLREELGPEKWGRIWDEFWQKQLDESKGQEELSMSVAGGKMIVAFRHGQEKQAEKIRDAVDACCRENGFGDNIVSEVRSRDAFVKTHGR